jgi:hypothetical protein
MNANTLKAVGSALFFGLVFLGMNAISKNFDRIAEADARAGRQMILKAYEEQRTGRNTLRRYRDENPDE